MIDLTGEIDYDRLKAATTTGVKILNAIIDKGEYPNDIIQSKVLLSRKIGLGVMGVADFFIKLKIVYGSEESLELVNDINTIMLESCVAASHTYPATFEAMKHYIAPLHIEEALANLGIENYSPANATLMTIAPTGTISMLANCSSGIEPVFFFESTENRVDDSRKYIHPLYAEFREAHPRLRIPAYFISSHDIDIDSHIQMQATFLRYVCNAVSKTINLPKINLFN
jgi:ribonucleoside-diphosphate reductase alpha chain